MVGCGRYIGNPLVDVIIAATDEDLHALGLDKGIMHLVTESEQRRILDHFKGKPRTILPGGAAPNTMVALAGLGVPSVISGKIGDDEFGATCNQQVAAYGVTSRLVTGTGMTGSSVILVTPDGERTMNTHLGMCREFSAADLAGYGVGEGLVVGGLPGRMVTARSSLWSGTRLDSSERRSL